MVKVKGFLTQDGKFFFSKKECIFYEEKFSRLYKFFSIFRINSESEADVLFHVVSSEITKKKLKLICHECFHDINIEIEESLQKLNISHCYWLNDDCNTKLVYWVENFRQTVNSKILEEMNSEIRIQHLDVKFCPNYFHFQNEIIQEFKERGGC